MKRQIRNFIFYFFSFWFGLFFGEWLFDLAFKIIRSSITIELVEAGVTAFIVAILFTLFTDRRKK